MTDDLEAWVDACRRVWEATKRIVADTLAVIVRWFKRNEHTLRAVARAIGYRPETMMRRKLRRAFAVRR